MHASVADAAYLDAWMAEAFYCGHESFGGKQGARNTRFLSIQLYKVQLNPGRNRLSNGIDVLARG